jgi:hypothetical protein
MNFLRWWTVALMLFGATMSLCIGVVCLLYVIYIDSSPEIRGELPLLEKMVGLFLILFLLGGSAVIPLWRKNRWLWPTQALLLVGTVTVGITFWRALSA